MRQNLRFALRMLGRNPGFTAAAIACLALGIGATTAIFSVVNAVLLRPLPYSQPGRLVRVFTEFPRFPNGGLRHFWMSPPEYFELKRDTKSWETLEAWASQGVNLAGASDPVRAQASYVTGGMLPTLGVAPLFGRLLAFADDLPNVPRVAVLSFGLWQRAFGGDRSILGRDIRLNGSPCTVVGVMPAAFTFPPGETDASELWAPIQLDPARPGGRGSHFLNVLGRLHAGVTQAQAQDEMLRYAVHSKATIARHPFDPENHPIVLAGFQDEIVKTVRRAMLVLMGAVVCVLLIACVNVANLLLARSEARRREIAVRAAIGAGIGRLLQQFAVEGVMISLAGAAAGVFFAFGGLRLLAAANPGDIPRAAEVSIDWQVLLFTLAVSLLTGLAFGLAPVLHVRPSRLFDLLKSASGRVSAAAAANRFRAVLVSAELALALVLLIGSGLMLKAFRKLQEVDAGIRPDRILTLQLSLPSANYRDAAARRNLYDSLNQRVNRLPGVASAAIASGLPPDRRLDANDTGIEGFVPRQGGPIQNVDFWNSVTGRYFETLGARLVEGRFINDGDGANSPLVVNVNLTMARTFWPNESAIGHRVRPPGNDTGPWYTVVGVIGDIKNGGIDRPTGTELYFPFAQQPRSLASLVIRTHGEPASILGAVRGEIRSLDRALPVSNVRTMEDVMSRSRARPRFLTVLLTLFSTVSLLLAALGIYGVISYSVAQRTNEIGIRMALGAQSGDVLRMVGATGVRLALAGIVLGAAGAFALTRTLSGLLFGVSSADPLTFLTMAAVLAAVTLLACLVPARRASRVDPLVALRYE
jgi:putative ABC transport system permease protein